MAIAIAFCSSTQLVFANPSGAQVVAGQATLSGTGNALVVTTQNATGTNYSAINWQSFNIPAGSSTRFVQPSASSTSINRVQSNNPSAIFGTLSSNGNLVLVNPSGITVGAGAVVDTAGFAASTLPMSNADALAGRQRFAADATQASGSLQVQGNIIARNGDVVLIAPNVEVAQTGIVQAPNGAAILAAGQSVEVTGRGLEGIRMAVQAPSDRAVNLGTLEGDAVAIFASSLKHSGLIKATAVSTDGGRVILRGEDLVEVEGVTKAERLNRLGGLFQATADKVGLSGAASVDVSGANGGGQILIGGDYQGKNPNVRNAQMTFVGAGAQLNANATDQGNGGKVIVWSDRSTRVFGDIQAKGGVNGGDGGLVETSGKVGLEFGAKVDVGAVGGKGGTLLLDPESITIVGGDRPGNSVTSITPATINFSDATPTQVFQSDLQQYKNGTNIVLEATSGINVSGTFNGSALTLTPDTNISLSTRNLATDTSTGTLGIDLLSSVHGANFELRTQGIGNINLQSSTGGSSAQTASINVGKLTTSEGSIAISAQGRTSDVLVNGSINTGVGTINIKATNNVRFEGNVPLTLRGNNVSLNGGNGTIVNTDLSDLSHSGSTWTNSAGSLLIINGTLRIGPNTSLFNAGTLDLAPSGVLDTGNQSLTNLSSGTLQGFGTLRLGAGTLVNNGTVAPGRSIGTLKISGNFTQSATGSLNIEVAGAQSFDMLEVSGTANLGGSLVMQSLGYKPTSVESYSILKGGAIKGEFTNLASSAFVSGSAVYTTSQIGFTTSGTGASTSGTGTSTSGTGTSTSGTGTSTSGTGTSTSGTGTSTSGTGTSTSGTGTNSLATMNSNLALSIFAQEMKVFAHLSKSLTNTSSVVALNTLLNLNHSPNRVDFLVDEEQVCR